MSERIPPAEGKITQATEFYGLPVLDEQEVKLLTQIFSEATLNNEDPFTYELGQRVVLSDERVCNALEHQTNHHVRELVNGCSDLDYMMDFEHGFTEGYYATCGVITWAYLHRRGLAEKDFFAQAKDSGDVPVISPEVLQNFTYMVDKYDYEKSDSGVEYHNYLFIQAKQELATLGKCIDGHLISRGLGKSEGSSGEREGAYEGAQSAAVLYQLAHEDRTIDQMRSDMPASWQR